MKKEIKLQGASSTILVMEWIRDNNSPFLDCQRFAFDDGGLLIVSTQDEKYIEFLLEEHPLDTWYEYEGMRRLYQDVFGSPMWYFNINGHYYYLTSHRL